MDKLAPELSEEFARLYQRAIKPPFPPNPDFESIWRRCGKLRVPFRCNCEDFERGVSFNYRVGARLRGDGNASPWTIVGNPVVGRCAHEAYFLANEANEFPLKPKSINVTKGPSIKEMSAKEFKRQSDEANNRGKK